MLAQQPGRRVALQVRYVSVILQREVDAKHGAERRGDELRPSDTSSCTDGGNSHTCSTSQSRKPLLMLCSMNPIRREIERL
ncbi:hypothetical protein [Nannocystis pusilla]|uniref:hypothetical protein n=1 Tax=Nannocystis pusilla TaxID=889268 RepID=UPI003BF3FB51